MIAERPYPVYLSLAGRTVVVVGGGTVGRRKVLSLAESGAAVVVVDPNPAALGTGAGNVRGIPEEYRADHLRGAALVIAAGPAAVNAAVVRDAAALGVWVCDAAEPDRGTFAVPAVVRSGRLTLAVGTGGASPVLSRRIAARLATEYDERFAEWVQLLAEFRTIIRASVPDPAVRRALNEGLADWRWLDRLRAGESVKDVRAAMRAIVDGGHRT
ncbi:MAG: precorrin-2 dehydrogenase/sirohydrochlorin ferrochelatase family protein [Fimbriiglobus sp.]